MTARPSKTPKAAAKETALREQFLAAYAAMPPGADPTAVCASVGITWRTVRRWCEMDGDFENDMMRIDEERRSAAMAVFYSEIMDIVRFQTQLAKGALEIPPDAGVLMGLEPMERAARIEAYAARQRDRQRLSVQAAKMLFDTAGMTQRAQANGETPEGFNALPNTPDGLEKERKELRSLKRNAIERWMRAEKSAKD